MAFWMLKSEPSAYSWQMMEKDGETTWDGVRNYQAQNNMKSMRKGDLAFFYHSISEKSIVGIVEICKEHYMADDPKFGQVIVKMYKSLKKPITLQQLKENEALKSLSMLKQSRLSVSPVTEEEWNEILKMSE